MIQAVLFDLDGTLLHTAPDLVGALNWLRARHGLPELAVAEMQTLASRGSLKLLEAGMPPADAETLRGWQLEFLSRYEQNIFRHSNLYDGVPDVLSYLDDNGLPWGIVTDKPEYLALPILSAAGLRDSAGCIICGDSVAERKPHPAPVIVACEQLNVAVGRTLFVGDDLRDIEAGQAAGVKTCAALYGYGAAELRKPENLHLVDGGIVIETPAELIAWLEGSIGSDREPATENG